LANQNLLLCIIEAPVFDQHGHRWGYRNLFFLKEEKNELHQVAAIRDEEDQLIGDQPEYDIVEIGKNNVALVSTFLSAGNRHLEKSKTLFLLDLGKLTPLITIDLEYDNSTWNTPQDENSSCEAYSYKCDFKVLKTDKNWYDIQVHRVGYEFSKGCKERLVKSESDRVLIFDKGKYVEKK
jgi:hypothetical protein